MKLYFSPGACSLHPHIALREAGLKFDLVRVDLLAHKLAGSGDDYYGVNPKGYVPLLQLDDGSRLTEGAVIDQYVADQNPDARLIPRAGTLERYRAQEWLNFIATELHKQFSPLFSSATPDEMKNAAAPEDRRSASTSSRGRWRSSRICSATGSRWPTRTSSTCFGGRSLRASIARSGPCSWRSSTAWRSARRCKRRSKRRRPRSSRGRAAAQLKRSAFVATMVRARAPRSWAGAYREVVQRSASTTEGHPDGIRLASNGEPLEVAAFSGRPACLARAHTFDRRLQRARIHTYPLGHDPMATLGARGAPANLLVAREDWVKIEIADWFVEVLDMLDLPLSGPTPGRGSSRRGRPTQRLRSRSAVAHVEPRRKSPSVCRGC